MEKIKSNLIVLIVSLIVLAGLFLLGRFLYKKHKESQLIKSGESIGSTEGLGVNDLERLIKEIKQKDIAKEQKTASEAPIKEIGEAIYNAKGVFNDDENAIYVALGRLKSKVSLALLNDYFIRAYGKSLLSFLDFLDTEELGKVNNILNKLK